MVIYIRHKHKGKGRIKIIQNLITQNYKYHKIHKQYTTQTIYISNSLLAETQTGFSNNKLALSPPTFSIIRNTTLLQPLH